MPPKRQPRPENLVQNQGESVSDEEKKSEKNAEAEAEYEKFIEYAK